MSDECPNAHEWSRLLADELAAERRDTMAAHLAGCEICRRRIDALVGTLSIPAGVGAIDAKGKTRAGNVALDDAISRLLSAARSLEKEPQDDLLPKGLLKPSTTNGSRGRLGKYEIFSVIGRGGLGIVLKGQDPQLNRTVAIKIPLPELAANPTVRRRFLREAQAAAAVSHPHVVTIHAVDEADGMPYLVMEYISGVSLQQELDRQGPLDLKKILRIGLQTASGLAAAHKQGLIHRDVKPANILLENGIQRVKLTDFGLARAVDDASITQSGVIAGTPQYMSPEQARGELIDARTDLFSLGAVLYAMCTGRPAFRADSTMAVLKRVCDDEPRPISQLNAEIPDWLCRVIDRLLAKDPIDRYQTADEVSEALSGQLAAIQEPEISRAIIRRPEAALELRPRPIWRVFDHWGFWAIVLGLMLLWMVALPGVYIASEQPAQESVTRTAVTYGNEQSHLVQGAQSIEPERPPAPVTPPEVVLFPFAVYSVQFTPNDRELLVGTWGTGLSFIDRATGAVSPGPRMDHPYVTRAITLPENRIAATAQPGTFQVFDMNNEGAAQSYRAGDKTIWQISASADGKLIAGGGEGGIVTVWSQTDGVQRIFKHKGVIHAVAMMPDGSHVVTGCADGKVRVFNIAEDKEVRALNNVSASDIVVLSDNRRILIGSADYRAYLWDYTAENSLEKYSGHTSTVTTVAVSSDEQWIVTGSDDNTVRVWNLATKEQAKRYTGHTQNVTRVCVAPDRRQLASASKDQTVRLWDMPRSEASSSKLETPPATLPKQGPETTDEASGKQEPKPVIDPQSDN